jgi:hypothetical protein
MWGLEEVVGALLGHCQLGDLVDFTAPLIM